MRLYIFLFTLGGIFCSCQQEPLQWTENKDPRLVNTKWVNEDSSDFWEFDSVLCRNKKLESYIYDSLGPYSMTTQWESLKNCTLAIHVKYNFYTPGEPITYHYYHKNYQYILSDASVDSVLTVNGEKFIFFGILHD